MNISSVNLQKEFYHNTNFHLLFSQFFSLRLWLSFFFLLWVKIVVKFKTYIITSSTEQQCPGHSRIKNWNELSELSTLFFIPNIVEPVEGESAVWWRFDFLYVALLPVTVCLSLFALEKMMMLITSRIRNVFRSFWYVIWYSYANMELGDLTTTILIFWF